MAASERLQPRPKTPFPALESYDRLNCGPKPERPALVIIGTDMLPAPVAGLAPNFSPIPLIAPPPLGSDKLGSRSWSPRSLEFCGSVWSELGAEELLC